jgi:hypothetical protein
MLFSQGQDTVYKKKNFLQRMDSVTNWKLEKGRSTFTPFIAPSYTQETQRKGGYVRAIRSGRVGRHRFGCPGLGRIYYWLPNGGIGLRFEIQKRMNLRIDYGFGAGSSAFYFSFNEAF